MDIKISRGRTVCREVVGGTLGLFFCFGMEGPRRCITRAGAFMHSTDTGYHGTYCTVEASCSSQSNG